MSDTAAGLRRKIGSAEDLHSVVRTMKSLAASSIAQYEQSVQALAEYCRAVELGLRVGFRAGAPAAAARGRGRAAAAGAPGVVVFGSDQGLVGRFNDAVADHAVRTLAALRSTAVAWAVGERVHARLEEAGLQVAGLFAVPNSVQAIAPLVGRVLVDTETSRGRGEIGELHLVHNRPAPGAAFAPFSRRLLPLDEPWRAEIAELPWPTGNLPEILGDPAPTVRALIREYLFVSLFRACAESLASENASRLAAMQRAEQNIDELMQDLTRTFHRLRQSGIDAELFDVISGYESLA